MKKLLFTLFAALAALTAYAQTDIKVEVHRVVEVGEQFNVTFIIEGENSVSDFAWAPSDDFQLLWLVTQQFQVIPLNDKNCQRKSE